MKNKFNAQTKVIDGIKFDSIREATHYSFLKLQMKAIDKSQRVAKIERQIRFDIIINDKKIAFYKADFKVTFTDGRVEYHDPKNPYRKGAAYQYFNLKKKLVEAQYGITIKLI